MKVLSGLLLLLSASNVLGQQVYENHVLRGKRVQFAGFLDTIDDCVGACTGRCSAVSYHVDDNVCILTACGSMLVGHGEGWITVVMGKPAIAGETVPMATHEWPMTDQCGGDSMGVFSRPSMALVGSAMYRYSRSDLYGNAAYFPNTVPTTGAYARVLSDSSISAYNGAATSFSIAFYVYIVALPAQSATLVEFTSGASISWLYWLWPDGQHVHYHVYSGGKDYYNQVEWKVSAGAWNHIAYSYDASAGTMTVLINGTEAATHVTITGQKNVFDGFTVGSRVVSGVNYGLNGAIYCLSMYNQTISAAMTKEIMRSCVDGKVRFEGRRHDVFNV